MQQLSVSFLLFLSPASALLLFALGAPDFGEFHELLNLKLFLDGRFGNPLLPLLFDLMLAKFLGLALHAHLLGLGVLFQIELVQTLVFVLHELALAPLLEALSVKHLFVALQEFLNGPNL